MQEPLVCSRDVLPMMAIESHVGIALRLLALDCSSEFSTVVLSVAHISVMLLVQVDAALSTVQYS
jgi:hypothetical protein